MSLNLFWELLRRLFGGEKLKIGILSPAFELGGASKVSTYIGNLLQSEGNEVFYISYLESARPDSSGNYYNIFREKNFFSQYISKSMKYLEFKRYGYFSPDKYVKKELGLLQEIVKKENPDVIIFNTFIPAVLFSSFIKKNFPSIKMITWMHSDPEYSLNHIAKYYKKIFKNSFKQVDRVVCLSDDVKNIVSQYGANAEVIYNPLTLSEHGVSELSDNVISFTARLDINVKGIDYLCELADFIPDNWVIRIAGDGTKDEKKQLQDLIEKNKVEKKINFVGPLYGKNLVEHYLNSSIFISTSRTEGLPLVMIEAISFGVPIVSFDHNGGKEILSNGKYGVLVPNNDVSLMGKEINKIIDDRSLLENYQNLSLKRSKDFSINIIIQKWKSLLNDLVLEGK